MGTSAGGSGLVDDVVRLRCLLRAPGSLCPPGSGDGRGTGKRCRPIQHRCFSSISLNPNTTALAALSSSRSISSSPKPLLTRPTESRDHDREGDEEPELTDANAMSLRGDVHASKFRLQLAGA